MQSLPECKPRHCSSGEVRLIKATQPLEWLILDFIGPLATFNQNKHILAVVDEFSRFPLAFSIKDVIAVSVIGHLDTLFNVFGMLLYVQLDMESAFVSSSFKNFLHEINIAANCTT